MRIAIVGTGIAGLTTAHHLHRRHDVHVLEAAPRLGGHAHTVTVDLADGPVDVDTGFIVYNERNYPGLTALFDELGVATQPSEMSFAVRDERTGFEWRGSTPASAYAHRGSWRDLGHHRMLVDVARFNLRLARLLREVERTGDDRPELTLRRLVADGRYGDGLVDGFLIPFGSSIWSADPRTLLDFPAVTWARFMANHGLLRFVGMPAWRTVAGGSQRYVDAVSAPFRDRVRLATPVHKVLRHEGSDGGGAVEVLTDDGPERFDAVVLACHSDQALSMLGDADPIERDVLGALRYESNVATLHTDEQFLPRDPRVRASWNYHLGAGDGTLPTLTYWMNRLQSIESREQVLVTLNRHDEVDPSAVLGRFEYAHPVYDPEAVRAQRRRHEIQGRRGTWFAGAYWGHGFHEDGLQSGLDVVQSIEGAP